MSVSVLTVEGFTPLRDSDAGSMKTSVGDVLRRLLQPRSMMSSAVMESGFNHCVLSALAILQGRIDPMEIYSSLARIKSKHEIRFVFLCCQIAFFPLYRPDGNNLY